MKCFLEEFRAPTSRLLFHTLLVDKESCGGGFALWEIAVHEIVFFEVHLKCYIFNLYQFHLGSQQWILNKYGNMP